jgi:hypothetical protein
VVARKSAFSALPIQVHKMEVKTEIFKKIILKINKSKVNLILSHINNAFFILDTQIGPQTFRHTYCTLRKKVFLNVKKGSIQGSICFKTLV